MRITPLDIQQQQFKGKMLGGLDADDVDAFLQSVAMEMENLLRENTEIKEQLTRQNREIAEMSEREKDLRETMLAAQRITEEMKANAQKEAALLLTEAQLKGDRIIADAERQLIELNAKIQESRRQKMQFDIELKGLLDAHARLLTAGDQL
jgi:cell division initiation protein